MSPHDHSALDSRSQMHCSSGLLLRPLLLLVTFAAKRVLEECGVPPADGSRCGRAMPDASTAAGCQTAK